MTNMKTPRAWSKLTCWLRSLATLRERATFRHARRALRRNRLRPADPEAVERLVLFCQGCRS